MLSSEVPRLTTDSPGTVFPGVWKLLSFLRLPSWDGSPSLPLLPLFLSFIFFPTSFQRQWAAFLGAWCPLPAFRSCFVEFTQCSNVLLMNLLGRKWSPCRIPLPSSANPPKASLSSAVTLGIKVSTFRSCWMSILPSWQIDGEKVEMTHFIFLGSKITVDGDCSWKIKKCLLLGRKAMTNLDSVFKSRDITLPTKVHIVKAVVFAVVMYGCESWIIKKAEHRIIDAFELWCWKRLLRVPWIARRSNQSILREINPKYSLRELMLKLQYLTT